MTALVLIGEVFMGVSAVLLILCLWTFLRERLEWQRESNAQRDGELAIRRMAERMIQDSYWFSESHDAYRAVYLIASKLNSQGSYGISSLRDEWRRERSERKQPPAPEGGS